MDTLKLGSIISSLAFVPLASATLRCGDLVGGPRAIECRDLATGAISSTVLNAESFALSLGGRALEFQNHSELETTRTTRVYLIWGRLDLVAEVDMNLITRGGLGRIKLFRDGTARAEYLCSSIAHRK